MANATRPWFQFYARDWLTDDKVMLMSLECQGAYLRLLCLQWENGAIPKEPEAVGAMLGFQTKDSRRYFFDRLWPALQPHFPTHRDTTRRNHRMVRLRDTADTLLTIAKKAGKKGGLQSAYNKRVRQRTLKQANKPPSSDGDGDGDGEEERREETPLTPLKKGGDKFPAGDQESGSRAAGTNPRAVAAAEAKKTEDAEAKHRHQLIQKLETAGETGGAYVGMQGFKLWGTVTTAELEELSN